MAPTLLGRLTAPLLSTNEPEAVVVEVRVEGYSEVRRGDVVCVLETTKATADLESEWDGYTGPLSVQAGDHIRAGEVVCEVFDEVPERSEHPGGAEAVRGRGGPRLSRGAERLALEAGVDLSLLPLGRFVTEADVRALVDAAAEPAAVDESILGAIGDRSIVVFGAGGHAKSVIDLVRSSTDYEPLCVADDDPQAGDELFAVPIVHASALATLREHGLRYAANAVGGVARIEARIEADDRLRALGFELPALADGTAFVAASASLAEGVQVFANAAVCSAAEVGSSAIVNTGAVVSHDCRIGANAHVAPGALLAGGVEIGEATLVGMGVTLHIGVRIGPRSIVGNGAVVNEDVPAETIVPVNTVWPAHQAKSPGAQR